MTRLSFILSTNKTNNIFSVSLDLKGTRYTSWQSIVEQGGIRLNYLGVEQDTDDPGDTLTA